MINSSITNFVTIEEFLQLAISFEVQSAQFYRELQKTATADDAIELLRLLEQQEIEHEKVLRNYAIEEDLDSLLQFPPSLALSMPQLSSKAPDFDEMLSIAIEREKRSAAIYERAADMVSGDFGKLLTGLSLFERAHEEKLRSLQSFY